MHLYQGYFIKATIMISCVCATGEHRLSFIGARNLKNEQISRQKRQEGPAWQEVKGSSRGRIDFLFVVYLHLDATVAISCLYLGFSAAD